MENRIYLCIDLKSFYASVECIDRKEVEICMKENWIYRRGDIYYAIEISCGVMPISLHSLLPARMNHLRRTLKWKAKENPF